MGYQLLHQIAKGQTLVYESALVPLSPALVVVAKPPLPSGIPVTRYGSVSILLPLTEIQTYPLTELLFKRLWYPQTLVSRDILLTGYSYTIQGAWLRLRTMPDYAYDIWEFVP